MKEKVVGILPFTLKKRTHENVWDSFRDGELLVKEIVDSPMKTVYNLPVYRTLHFCPVRQNIAYDYLFLSAIMYPSIMVHPFEDKGIRLLESIVSYYRRDVDTFSLPFPLNKVENYGLFIYPARFEECDSYTGKYDEIESIKLEGKYDFGEKYYSKQSLDEEIKLDLKGTTFKTETTFKEFLKNNKIWYLYQIKYSVLCRVFFWNFI